MTPLPIIGIDHALTTVRGITGIHTIALSTKKEPPPMGTHIPVHMEDGTLTHENPAPGPEETTLGIGENTTWSEGTGWRRPHTHGWRWTGTGPLTGNPGGE